MIGIVKAHSAEVPLLCIDVAPDSETRGKLCAGCDVLCPGFAAGRFMVEQTSQNKLLDERIAQLHISSLIPTALTPEGLGDEIRNNPLLNAELQQGNWGVINLDVRFLKAINDIAYRFGSEFLQVVGEQIRDALAKAGRQGDPSNYDRADRRQEYSTGQDILCRIGGDEFSILVRNVDPRRLIAVANRITGQFSVGRVIAQGGENKVPFIASVGAAHVRHSSQAQQYLLQGDVVKAFQSTFDLTDEGHREMKAKQYQQMWHYVRTAEPLYAHPEMPMPDERTIAQHFLVDYFAAFWQSLQVRKYVQERPDNPAALRYSTQKV
jgi:GGDEF domain-containing protein